MSAPVLTPIPRDEIRDPALVDLLARCEALGVPDAHFVQMIARVPSYAKAVLDAMLYSHVEGAVDHRLKETMRILLARFAADPHFAGLRSRSAVAGGLDEARIEAGVDDYERDTRFTDAERAALRFADTLFRNPDAVDAAFYADLKRHYTEAQIMELGAFMALWHGIQVFMRTLPVAQAPRAN